MQSCFGPVLTTNIGSWFPMEKYVFFPISRRKFPNSSPLSPFCDILTVLCLSKLYFCIPNIKTCFSKILKELNEPNTVELQWLEQAWGLEK